MGFLARTFRVPPMQNNAQLAVDEFTSQMPAMAGAQTAAVRDRDVPLKVLYIAGDGRSGSTLLDRLIGAYPGVFSRGELGNLLQSTDSADEYCACSERARECLFWHGVMLKWGAAVPGFSQDEYRMLQHRYERLRSLFRPFNELSLSSRKFARYAEYTRALFTAIADLSGDGVIVDSSKSPARAAGPVAGAGPGPAHAAPGADVRGVAYSLRIPYRERPKEGPFANVKRRSNLRFVGTWALVNYFCERVRTKLVYPVLFIRYEDYTAYPDRVLTEVAGLLGMPRIDYEAGAGHLLQQSHLIAGKRSAHEPGAEDRARRELAQLFWPLHAEGVVPAGVALDAALPLPPLNPARSRDPAAATQGMEIRNP